MKSDFLKMQKLFGLGAIAFALGALSACSSEDIDNTQIDPNKPDTPAASELQTENVLVVSDPDVLGNRVINVPTAVSRADGDFTMPERLTDEEAAALEEYADNATGNVKISGTNEVWLKNDTGSDLNVYVTCKDANIKFQSANNPIHIVILADASAKVNFSQNGKITVDVYGELTPVYNDWSNQGVEVEALNLNGQVVNFANDAVIDGDAYVTNNGGINVLGNLTVTGNFKFDTQTTAIIKCLTVGEKLTVSNIGKIYTNYISAKDLEITSSNAYIYMGAKGVVEVANEIYFPNHPCGFIFPDADPATTGYVKAASFRAQACSTWSNDAQANVTLMTCTTHFTGYVYIDIEADKVFALDGTTVALVQAGQPKASWKFQEGAQLPSITKEDQPCMAEAINGTTPDKTPDFDVVAVSDDHTHPISATSIALDGTTAYVTWHKRGVGYGSGNDDYNHNGISVWGCVEKYDLTNGLELKAWMETPGAYNKNYTGDKAARPNEDASNAYDFNHVLLYNGDLYLMADNDKKGAVIGKLAASELAGNGENIAKMAVRPLLKVGAGNDATFAGKSANAIVARTNADNTVDLLCATRGGYDVVPATTEYFSKVAQDNGLKGNEHKSWVGYLPTTVKQTAGSAKHIAYGEGKVATIEYTEARSADVDYDEDDYTTEFAGKISIWNAAEFLQEGATPVEITLPKFGPVYGKNVLVINGGKIYSCQGRNGVYVYSLADGTQLAHWAIPAKYTSAKAGKGAAANGLCVANGKVYVAAGAAGLQVLDAETLAAVASYEAKATDAAAEEYQKAPAASANYVQALADGRVLVAYGRRGVILLKPNKQF